MAASSLSFFPINLKLVNSVKPSIPSSYKVVFRWVKPKDAEIKMISYGEYSQFYGGLSLRMDIVCFVVNFVLELGWKNRLDLTFFANQIKVFSYMCARYFACFVSLFSGLWQTRT